MSLPNWRARSPVGHREFADCILEVVLCDVHQVGVHLTRRLERECADAEDHLILRKKRVATASRILENLDRKPADPSGVRSSIQCRRRGKRVLLANDLDRKDTPVDGPDADGVGGQARQFVEQVRVGEDGCVAGVDSSLCAFLLHVESGRLFPSDFEAADKLEQRAALIG